MVFLLVYSILQKKTIKKNRYTKNVFAFVANINKKRRAFL